MKRLTKPQQRDCVSVLTIHFVEGYQEVVVCESHPAARAYMRTLDQKDWTDFTLQPKRIQRNPDKQ